MRDRQRTHIGGCFGCELGGESRTGWRKHAARAGHELRDAARQAIGHVRNIRGARPRIEARRHDEKGVDDLCDPLILAVGTGQQIAEPLGARVEQGDHRRETAQSGEDLEESGEGANEGVSEPDRAAVIANDARTHRELAERSPVRQRLDEGGHEDREGHQHDDRQGLLCGRVDRGADRCAPHQQEQPDREDRGRHEIDDRTRSAEHEAGRPEV